MQSVSWIICSRKGRGIKEKTMENNYSGSCAIGATSHLSEKIENK